MQSRRFLQRSGLFRHRWFEEQRRQTTKWCFSTAASFNALKGPSISTGKGTCFMISSLTSIVLSGVIIAYSNGWNAKVLFISTFETGMSAIVRYKHANDQGLCQSMCGLPCSVFHRINEMVLKSMSDDHAKNVDKKGIFQSNVTSVRKKMKNLSNINQDRVPSKYPLLKFDEIIIDDVPCLFIHRSGQEYENLGNQAVVVETHGGGHTGGDYYLSCPMTAEIADQTGMPILCVNYALAPERVDLKQSGVQFDGGHQHIDQVTRVISWLHSESNVPLTKIGIIGDSAGGNTAMATLAHTHRKFEQDLGACVSVSGWLDLRYHKDGHSYVPYQSHTENCSFDPLIPNEKSPANCAHIVAYGSEVESKLNELKNDDEILDILKDPMLSPINASYDGLTSKVLLMASEFELLKDQSVEMHNKLAKQGVQSELRLMPTNLHSLPVSAEIPESNRELAYISHFLCNHLNQ